MTTPFNFSAGAVLTAAQLNEIGKYYAYTPTWGSITPGSGGAAAVSDAMYAKLLPTVANSAFTTLAQPYIIKAPVAHQAQRRYLFTRGTPPAPTYLLAI